MKFLFTKRLPTNTTISYPYKQSNGSCGAVRVCQKPKDTEREPGDQPKFVSSPSAPLSWPGLQQIPKEKETQDETICTQRVFASGDAFVHLRASPFVVIHSPLGIIFDEENGNRDDHIGAPLHQARQRFFGIRFRKDDERHDRMTKNFDPPFESYEWKIRPGDGNETVEQKSDEPAIVPNNF